MATSAIETRQAKDANHHHQQSGAGVGGEGLRQYYQQRIQDLELQACQKTHDLQRLEAHRNNLSGQVRSLKEELELLQEPGSYVGEVVKVMGKSKVLVKVSSCFCCQQAFVLAIMLNTYWYLHTCHSFILTDFCNW
ncbi:26S proteasome regulatory subunit 8 homolog A-like [Olea europaea var. sylvestris]|uniref:26S proteasome regulatory subunit 8 homolog A-like n=1 Tax=Olea europaea var. sylvestris TaxID=158386 RepID=UPI000C1D2F20|nr:26S proteasome regulatory subunit 8 homolog A-like [Olea europaea var. sylvestris]